AMPRRRRGALAGCGRGCLRRLCSQCAGQCHCLGTVMRHDLLLAAMLAIAARAPRMREAPGAAGLVALAGLALRLATRRAGAVAAEIALAAIAAAPYQHLQRRNART